MDDPVNAERWEDDTYSRPSPYSPRPYVFRRQLVQEAKRHLLLDTPLNISCPVRILHGNSDPVSGNHPDTILAPRNGVLRFGSLQDVPAEDAMRLFKHLHCPDKEIALIKGGDHRLSRPADLDRIMSQVEELRCSQAASCKGPNG